MTPDQVDEKVSLLCTALCTLPARYTSAFFSYNIAAVCAAASLWTSCADSPSMVVLLQQAQSAGEHAPTGTKADNKRGPTTAQAIAAEESVRRVERWRYVHPFFPFVRKWTSFFLNTLKCMKTAALRLKYSDIGDFIYKMGILDVSFGRYMQRGWTHRVGYLREKFQKFSQEYVRQLSELHLRLKTYLEVRRVWLVQNCPVVGVTQCSSVRL